MIFDIAKAAQWTVAEDKRHGARFVRWHPFPGVWKAPETESGIASAVNNAASRLAGWISVVIVGSVAAAVYLERAQSLVPGGNTGLRFGVLPDPSSPVRATFEAAFVEGYRAGMLLAAGLAGLAAVTRSPAECMNRFIEKKANGG